MTGDSIQSRSPALFAGGQGVMNGPSPGCTDHDDMPCRTRLEIDGLKAQVSDFVRDTAERTTKEGFMVMHAGLSAVEMKLMDSFRKDSTPKGMPPTGAGTGQTRVVSENRDQLTLQTKPSGDGFISEGLECRGHGQGMIREDHGQAGRGPTCFA